MKLKMKRTNVEERKKKYIGIYKGKMNKMKEWEIPLTWMNIAGVQKVTTTTTHNLSLSFYNLSNSF